MLHDQAHSAGVLPKTPSVKVDILALFIDAEVKHYFSVCYN